jgi:hypothetical protein
MQFAHIRMKASIFDSNRSTNIGMRFWATKLAEKNGINRTFHLPAEAQRKRWPISDHRAPVDCFALTVGTR